MSERKAYPTDVSDEEWAFVAPYLTLMTEEAPQRDHSLREVFNGLRYVVRGGISWRMIPNDLPPWHTVYQQTQRWLKAGVFEAMVHDLRALLRLLTPTELTYQGGHTDRPYFNVLIARLLERCQALAQHYTHDPTPRTVWQERYHYLTQAAQGVRLAEHRTRWVRVKSGSRRTQSVNAVSGFVGEAIVEGGLKPLHEWLVWGASLHVGKNAVKGNGWYDLDNWR